MKIKLNDDIRIKSKLQHHEPTLLFQTACLAIEKYIKDTGGDSLDGTLASILEELEDKNLPREPMFLRLVKSERPVEVEDDCPA